MNEGSFGAIQIHSSKDQVSTPLLGCWMEREMLLKPHDQTKDKGSSGIFCANLWVSLVGQSAPPDMLQKLTYLVIRHDPQIKRVDTVRAYTFGVLYFVEVDIELPEDLPLKEAHSIGESLQDKIEQLPEVERAFVHLDFECDHKPEHSVLSMLPNS